MRSFLLFVALFAAALLLASALAYPAWELVSAVSVQPLHRVRDRVAMLIALIGLIVLTRKLGLSDRESLGYGLPGPAFRRQLVIGWTCGIALMAPLVALLLTTDVRVPKAQPDEWLGWMIVGASISGLTIAFIEETFFRGVLFTAVQRTSGPVAAVLAPTALYAAVHFLGGKLNVPADEIGWQHGFIALANLFERYAQPGELVDSLLALTALGVLLALLRLYTGSIAAGIGLHAAGVATIAIVRRLTTVDERSDYTWLVGAYDGVIGWAALIWFGALALACVALRRRFARAATAVAAADPAAPGSAASRSAATAESRPGAR
jgi:uncharacterized protein